MSRVIFLDIDGVVVNSKTLYAPKLEKQARYNELIHQLDGYPEQTRELWKEHLVRDLYYLNTEVIEIINTICEEPDVVFVISSAWRILNSLESLQWMFKKRGFKGKIVDVTPRSHEVTSEIKGRVTRAHEIRQWLDQNPYVTDYAILDDDASDLTLLKDHLIHIDREVGVTKEDMDRVRLRLGL